MVEGKKGEWGGQAKGKVGPQLKGERLVVKKHSPTKENDSKKERRVLWPLRPSTAHTKKETKPPLRARAGKICAHVGAIIINS